MEMIGWSDTIIGCMSWFHFWWIWMNWIEINISLRSSVSLQINIVNNLIRDNSVHYWNTLLIITKNDLLFWLICKNVIVSTLVNMVKNVLICLKQSMLVDDNITCSQENNLKGSYSVDTNIEDWTYWYGSQPYIDEVTDQIPSWWPVFPSTEDSRQLFSYRTN